MMIFAIIAVGGAFGQRVGDTVQVSGQPYTIETVSGDVLTLRKVAAQGDGPVNWVAVDATGAFGTANNNNQINGVAFGNNTWVAVGSGGKIAYSTDNGRSWTGVPAGTAANQTGFRSVTSVNAVAFANNMFIAVGGDGTNAGLAGISYSTDGRTWTAVASPPQGGWNGIAYGGGRWVIVGGFAQSVPTQIAYSTDGRTWTMVDVSGAIPSSVYGVAFANNRFVAISNGRTATSTNGSSWTAAANSPSNILRDIAYGNNRWVTVGNGRRMAYSSDGAAWTTVTNANTGNFDGSNDIFGVGFGNNRFVAVGVLGKISYSTDGAAWTGVANSTFANNITIRAVAYGNGRFVAVGTNGRMAYCDW